MATLIQDEAQVRACEEINRMLGEVELINRILADQSWSCVIPYGKTKLTIDPALRPKMDSILSAQKAKAVKSIQSLAAKYKIALSDEDKAIIK